MNAETATRRVTEEANIDRMVETGMVIASDGITRRAYICAVCGQQHGAHQAAGATGCRAGCRGLTQKGTAAQREKRGPALAATNGDQRPTAGVADQNERTATARRDGQEIHGTGQATCIPSGASGLRVCRRKC